MEHVWLLFTQLDTAVLVPTGANSALAWLHWQWYMVCAWFKELRRVIFFKYVRKLLQLSIWILSSPLICAKGAKVIVVIPNIVKFRQTSQ